MALLTYGVTERKGFILLTGEVGTGKTTMIHNLISNLDAGVEYVYLVNPLLTPQEFIDYLAFSSFKKRVHFRSKADFLLEFEEFLQKCFQNQKIFILIIDEAHKLSFELLEEIRLLSNMEYAEEKLINVFLVGQPELNENLNSPRGRATLQRIGIRYDIPPLSLKETAEYIDMRLMVAGAPKKSEIFQKDAVEAIYRFSQGYPRTINILADNAMLLGYSRDKKTINASMIEESYNAMRLEGSFLDDSAGKPPEIPPVLRERHSDGVFKWVFAALILIIIALLLFMAKTSRINIPYISGIAHEEKAQNTAPAPLSVIMDQIEKDETGSSGGLLQSKEGGMDSIRLTDLTVFVLNQDRGLSKSVMAKEGDTLTSLAEKVYGHAGEEELDLLKQYNPEISNINQIAVGQLISFPGYTVLIAAYESFEKADYLYQQLINEGYDAGILSPDAHGGAGSFKVMVGAFKSKREAEDFAFNILEGKIYNVPK
ncbi:MAG: AAA family ATPase [Deltaproteobacteria bacterium]|nr:AAA family ATPase [Deltaproteobacteria bacterium]